MNDNIDIGDLTMTTSWSNIINSVKQHNKEDNIKTINSNLFDDFDICSDTEIDDEDLQEKFLNIVNKMKESNCKLPESFELFYTIKKISDEDNTIIKITPSLTEQNAKNICKTDSNTSITPSRSTYKVASYETIYEFN